jgi:hypothetical protein
MLCLLFSVSFQNEGSRGQLDLEELKGAYLARAGGTGKRNPTAIGSLQAITW